MLIFFFQSEPLFSWFFFISLSFEIIIFNCITLYIHYYKSYKHRAWFSSFFSISSYFYISNFLPLLRTIVFLLCVFVFLFLEILYTCFYVLKTEIYSLCVKNLVFLGSYFRWLMDKHGTVDISKMTPTLLVLRVLYVF